MTDENRLPRAYVWTVVVLCALPTILRWAGADFGSPPIDAAGGTAGGPDKLVDQYHVLLAGSFIHTILEWSAFLAALFTVLLSFTHYSIQRDAATPIIGAALFCAGAIDAFHVLAADRLIAAVADNRQFIPFTWVISRIFNVSITILGTLVLLSRRGPSAEPRRESVGFLLATCAGFGFVAYAIIYWCANSTSLPATMFPDAVVRRPFDVLPLVLYVAAGWWLYPRFYRRYPSPFSHALILSVLPAATTQLHMAFGSQALYDHHFNVAHVLKAVAYVVPLLGLLLDYTRTYRRAELAREELEHAHEELEGRVRERTAELGKAKETAVAASRAKSDFLAHMSHELRTPLNSILGYAQILRRDPTLGDRQRSGVSVIESSGEHLLTLINDVLDLSKIEAGKLEVEVDEFSLPSLLGNLADSERVRAEKRGLVFTYLAETPLPQTVRGDERKLRQILLNLIGNAIKFTERGSVTLRVGRDSATRRQCPLRFTVEDTGSGIADDELRKIFRPFHQAGDRAAVEGTGLGLAITCRLVEVLGGEITVDSKLGEGSTFSVLLHLPEVEGSAATSEKTARTVVGYRGDRRKILVVDDKAANRAVLVGLLAPLGFELVEAGDGREALVRAADEAPDLILMDLVMPVMDGFEATRRLRRTPALAEVVVIALSASVFDHNRQRSRTAGCDDFLPKPVRVEALLEQLGIHLGLGWIYAGEEESEAEASLGADAVAQAGESSASRLTSADAAALLELARRGDVQAISRRLDEVDRAGGAAEVNILRRLAAEYDMRAIREFLEPRVEPEA